ncbi:MAG: exodeoxyribonuclease VII small subunit [Lachnospiraceae bacterium]|nr:exodeoxyribonuclease VII small subunit [Lachnospiraceae bacterium]
MATEKKLNIDEMFQKIEDQIQILEREDVPLEESLTAYEEGMKYIKSCHEAITSVEKKVMLIRENGETDEL